MSIQAILFDLDRTLLDRDTAFRNFVDSQYDNFRSDFRLIPKANYIERVIQLDNRGLLWKDKVYQTVEAEFALPPGFGETLFADFDARIADFYLPLPGMRPMLDALKSDGYRLGLVTNGREHFQQRTIRKLGIADDFSAILISEAEGLRKPDPEIFLRALSRLQTRPENSLFVGDSMEADIRGAKSAGLFTAWITDAACSGSIDADFAFHTLGELPGLIRNMQSILNG